MKGEGGPRSVLPWQALAVIVVVLAGGVYLILPDDRELIDRYLDAGDPEKALEKLESAREIDPLEAALGRLEARRRIALERKDPAFWSEVFAQGVADYVELDGPAALREPLAEATLFLPDPAASARQISASLRELDRERARPVENALVARLLADGRPAAAAELFRELFPEEGFEARDLRELLRLRRAAGQEEQALADLARFRDLLPDEPGTRIALAVEKAGLLRSLNRVSEAFDLLYALWSEDPGSVRNDEFYRLLRSLSVAADRQPEIVPAVRARAEAVPADEAAFADALDLTLALVSAEEAAALLEDRREARGGLSAEHERLLARLHEWTGRPAAAFDQYRALALQGDPEAVGRLFELNEGLFRHFELAEALEEAPVAAVAGHRLAKARLLARIGEYEKAQSAYRRYLAAEEDRAEVWAELADVSLTIHDFAGALEAYRRAVALDAPREKVVRWRKDLAWILSLEGRYEEALEEYQGVFSSYGEEDVLPSIVSLASILGDRDLYGATLEEIVRRNPGSVESGEAAGKIFRQKEFGAERRWSDALNEYRRALAQLHADEGRPGDAVGVIEQHRDLFDDPEVFEFYLNVLAEDGRFGEGTRALESPRFSEDLLRSPDSLRTAVWILESTGRTGKALRLARGLVERFPGDASAGLTLARLLAQNGQPVEAERLLDEFAGPDAPAEVLLLASEVASAAGRYGEAERHLLRYMEAKGGVGSDDLTRLGDLRLGAGDRTGARESYRDAVRALMRREGANR